MDINGSSDDTDSLTDLRRNYIIMKKHTPLTNIHEVISADIATMDKAQIIDILNIFLFELEDDNPYLYKLHTHIEEAIQFRKELERHYIKKDLSRIIREVIKENDRAESTPHA